MGIVQEEGTDLSSIRFCRWLGLLKDRVQRTSAPEDSAAAHKEIQWLVVRLMDVL